MPACDVGESKAPCTPGNFLWQTLFARVDEKILSINVLLQMSLIIKLACHLS